MFGKNPTPAPEEIQFLLVPNFSMMAFTSAIEPLRAANRKANRTLYTWRTIGCEGSPTVASNGVPVVTDATLDTPVPVPHAVVVCAGLEVETYRNKAVYAWLRRMAVKGAALSGVCTGPLILARAGLLDGYRCTIHWENMESFVEEFPELDVMGTLFEIDRNRFTCSGGTAALDMVLHLVARDHSKELAMAAAEQMLHTLVRPPDDPQRMNLVYRTGIHHPKLLAAIAAMEAHLETPLASDDVASLVGVSPRQLERLFRTYLGTPPSKYYLQLRLKRANHLLAQTSMSVTQVAVACGFTSASHFTRSYRARFGITPRTGRPNRLAVSATA